MEVYLVPPEPNYRLAELAEKQIERVKAHKTALGLVLLAYTCD